MDFQVVLQNRDFTDRVLAGQSTLIPQSYSFNAIGGPDQCRIAVGGGLGAIWETVDWLRCPVHIYDARGSIVWWGYVYEVRIQAGATELGVSLDTMANRLMVVFEELPPGWATAGTAGATAWFNHDASVAEYGWKERRESGGAMTAAAAAQMRTMLAMIGYPTPVVTIGTGKAVSAVLECRGWWNTLDWQYYANPASTSVMTTTQIAAIVATYNTYGTGPWFTLGALMDATSLLLTNCYRDGNNTYRHEIEALLKIGNTSYKRLLAEVLSTRQIRVYVEPTSVEADDLWLDVDGRVWTEYGTLVEPHTCPCAQWVRLRGIIPDSANLNRVANPSPFFIERSEYNCATNILKLEPRGMTDAWDLGEVGQG